MLRIKWSLLAEITIAEEIDFILRKWNLVEADNFILLVYASLDRLAKNPEIGIFSSKFNCFSIVISKQTTLYYKVLEVEKQIELVLFWNNKQNPGQLSKLLR